mmetsp:Transcript_17789/g.25133  ORF Transcript_17789/g.25133 Transcript_17789/m.25133 type:complete len:88 (-) Transcript_17789:42-305(-)
MRRNGDKVQDTTPATVVPTVAVWKNVRLFVLVLGISVDEEASLSQLVLATAILDDVDVEDSVNDLMLLSLIAFGTKAFDKVNAKKSI